MHISQAGLDLIKAHEGLRLRAYDDGVGVLTIGYGHTRLVKPGDHITAAQAEALLRDDIDWAERAVNERVHVPLAQHEFDALVSLTFNIGTGAFSRSTLLRKLNQGDRTGAAAEFDRWNQGGGRVLRGLVTRRAAERALFEGAQGTAGPAPAPATEGRLTVRQIQHALNRAIQAQLDEDGILGPLTMAKIREFQQRHRLTVDGIVGPQTEAALREVLAP